MTTAPPQPCCPEYAGATRAQAATRRQFLTGALAGVGATAVLMATDAVYAQASFGAARGGNVVVLLSQRGAADGLSLLVPHGDPHYYQLRPSMSVPRERVLHLDTMFGLHPALEPLLPLYQSKQLGLVHAAGMATPNRSHFDAMAVVEDSAPGSATRTGWVNRLLGLDATDEAVEGVQLGTTTSPHSLYGTHPTLALPNLSTVGWSSWIMSSTTWRPAYANAYRRMWAGHTGRGATGANAAFATQDALAAASVKAYTPEHDAVYPTSSLATALKETARLIKADVGTRVVTVDSGAWDMHADLGNLESGLLKGLAADFAKSLAAFHQDLGPTMSRVTVIVTTEFGRRAAQNPSRGADHGWGHVMWALGAGVNGGKVYGTWPGLAPHQLVDGDLAVTTDYRQVFAETLRHRLDTDPARVLPNFRPAPLGLLRSTP